MSRIFSQGLLQQDPGALLHDTVCPLAIMFVTVGWMSAGMQHYVPQHSWPKNGVAQPAQQASGDKEPTETLWGAIKLLVLAWLSV